MDRKELKALLILAAALALHITAHSETQRIHPQALEFGGEDTYTSPVAIQGRRHPSYQVFAHQLQLPSIAIVDDRFLVIGEVISLDCYRLHLLKWREREAIAAIFEVPVGVIEHWLESLPFKGLSDLAALAQDLRITITDYRYLEIRWMLYNPPPGLEKYKRKALQALHAGNLNKAWEMYYALPRPGAPR